MGRIPSNEIYRILSEMKGTVGLYIEDCATGEILKINPELSFPACSVIKIPMLALLLRDGAEGRIDLVLCQISTLYRILLEFYS